jgi:flagellin
MSFEVNDVGSELIQRSLRTASKELETSMVKLATGQKLNAIEDAANLIINEEMESKRRGSQQAIENAQIGMNMLSTAESGLSSINDNLQRIRELAVQRENGTLDENGRAAIDEEINALTSEIDRVSKSTTFNGKQLLDGSEDDVSLQVGPDGEEETNRVDISRALEGSSSSDLDIDPSASNLIDQVDRALNTVNSQRSNIGAIQNGLESAVSSLYVQTENIAAAQSRISDVDVAAEVSKLTQNQILMNASTSLVAQANQSAGIAAILI